VSAADVEQLVTEDIYLGALALLRGGELKGIEVRGMNGRRLVVFSIAGSGMERVERDYYHSAVQIDLRRLKAEVARLKTVAFDALRGREKERGHGEASTDRSNKH
jgi:hypothetical protein